MFHLLVPHVWQRHWKAEHLREHLKRAAVEMETDWGARQPMVQWSS